jgi:myo-inositol-1(or 4)-monophosphatase
MGFEKELDVAKSAAFSAGEYLRTWAGNAVISKYKGNNSNYSTSQDIESNRLILGDIRRVFPEDHVLAEESAKHDIKEGRMWIIDSIDGTRNYLNGVPYFSVSIALWEDGEVKVGVVYAPCFNNEMYHAVKGKGAFLNGKPLAMINPTQEMKDVVIATGFAYYKGNELDEALRKAGEVIRNCADIARYGSAALDLCQVAAGRFGAFYENGLKPWDVAAGKLMVEECGGSVSAYNGGPLDIFNRVEGKFSLGVVGAKNPDIHSGLIRILNN